MDVAPRSLRRAKIGSHLRSDWRDVLVATRAEIKADRGSLIAAGVAFFLFLALVPALFFVTSVYGIAADPADVRRFALDSLAAAPSDVRRLVVEQINSQVHAATAGVSVRAAVAAVVSLWSASTGMAHLVEAVALAHGRREQRGPVRRRLVALGLTAGVAAFGIIAVVVVALLPSLLADTSLGTATRWTVDVLRWPLLVLALLVGVTTLYRVGSEPDEPRRWCTPGAALAALLWLVGSLLFSLYAANFSRLHATYGALASIVVVLLWLFLSAFAVVAGAELDAELGRRRSAARAPGIRSR
ncbi:MAG: YihY/virulence factor BrkB family protein [Acidimicrobiia bacterium]